MNYFGSYLITSYEVITKLNLQISKSKIIYPQFV